MNLREELKLLLDEDDSLIYTSFEVVENPRDPNHLKRKQQQRAITNEVILLCLNYGVKRRTYQDHSFTLTDRGLFNTPYFKHLDKLRGATIIGNWNDEGVFQVITSYWNFVVKQRKRF